MYSYHMSQCLFFFYFYCLFGWCFESTYVSLKEKRPVNRGFMRGPFLPLYGSGAVMMLVVSIPVRGNLVLTYLAGCAGATVLEYVTGVTMEALFKVRYWDYSGKKFNFQGQICLSSTLAWGALTILMTEVVHRPIEAFVLAIPMSVLQPVVFVLTILIVADFTLSFKAALDLRSVLVRMEHIREEMERMQKRLDVVIAVLDEEINSRIESSREHYAGRGEALLAGLEERFASLKEGLRSDRVTAEARDEIAELRDSFTSLRERRLQLGSVKDFYKRHLILGNPTMHSKTFDESLEELKQAALSHRQQREKNF